MKKLFISCPMKDRTEAQIRGTMTQMHNIAEAVFGEELDVIQTYIPDPPSGTNQALWYLGESIKMLSEADYFIGIYDGDYTKWERRNWQNPSMKMLRFLQSSICGMTSCKNLITHF